MYIGGTDEKALHHLFAEVIDNSMDEAWRVTPPSSRWNWAADGFLTVTDNGRGIPVDPHPKFPKKSALEVIMCTLHSGGKFDSKVYETSGGLHGVGVSVVNALSSRLEVEVARSQKLYEWRSSAAIPRASSKTSARSTTGAAPASASSPIRTSSAPRPPFKPQRLFKMARSKAYCSAASRSAGTAIRRC